MSIHKLTTGQYRARYRDAANREHARHFSRKVDAQRWLDSVTTAVSTGVYADPRLGRATVGELAEPWLAGQAHLKPSTKARYADIIRTEVLPRWGAVPINAVSHSDVQAWVSELAQRRAPETVRKTYRVLSMVLAAGVRDGRLGRNPAADVRLPRPVKMEMLFLDHEQVEQLAERCGNYRLVILVLAYSGLRWGEMAALRVGRIDFLRRRLTVAEAVTLVNGRQVWGAPKNYEVREVPLPPFLVDELAHHVQGKAADDLVFTGERAGQALRSVVMRRAGFNQAAIDLGVAGLRPHDLRHTAASLAIRSGASIKLVQRLLGHASAAVTLDRYGHLYPDELDDVAVRLDAARAAVRGRTADSLRTPAGLIMLPRSAQVATAP